MKSATTYIQSLCHRNTDRLAEQGILCPPAGANFAAVNVLLGSAYIRPWNDRAWDDLSESIQAHDGDVFLSNEILSLRSRRKAAQLVAAVSPAEVHILVTARDLARVIPSQWQEGAVNKQTVTWADFAASVCSDRPEDADTAGRFWRRHDLPAIFARWSEAVPVERSTLVTVPQGNPGTELVARCGTAIGADFSAFHAPEPVHTSLGAHSAELMRRLNAGVHDVDTLHYRTGFHKVLARSILARRSESEPRIGLSAEQHEWVAQRARAMIDDLATLGVSVVGDLAELLPAPYSGAGVDPTAVSDPDLLAAALDGLAGITLELADANIAMRAERRPDVS